jgi:DNA helicase-2/ATP-dependent DNA helicase PcrA
MPIVDPILGPLNETQREAVLHGEGPALILAGAGSGKTRALTHRIAYLISQGVPSWQILAVTFTNKAALEMKERIKALLKITNDQGTEPEHLPMSGTFHSICARILRRDIERIGRNRSYVIYDADDQKKLMQQTLKNMKITDEDLKPRTALSHIGHFKSEALSPHDIRREATTHTLMRMANVYDQYQHALREANALDFDDLLLETVRLFRECPDILTRYQRTWRFLHVDEYQDTNHAQVLFISLLAGKNRNLCVIGDPDQSIYAFRGADIRNILEFRNEYKDAKEIKLERNYRSTQQILDTANAVIAANPNRPKKQMWTDRKDGAKVVLHEVLDERREAEEAIRQVLERRKAGVPLKEQAILYRTNAQSRLFEEACLKAGLPYRIFGGVKFYARREVKDVLAYLYVILNPSDTVSLLRIINVPSRKIGETTIGRLQNFCNERKLSLWQAMKHIEVVEGLSESTKKRLSDFGSLIEELKEHGKKHVVSELAARLIDRIGLEKHLRDDTDEGEERWENVRELLSVARKYDHLPPEESLTSFLEEVALVSEVDAMTEDRSDGLTLMTLHLCKGLEFRAVTIVGCEEGLLPHSAALFDHNQLEEERRLLYVGMTRAKDSLLLLHAIQRSLWGDTKSNPRSRFLDDLPQTTIDVKSDQQESKFGWLLSSSPKQSIWKPAAAPHRGPANEFNQDTAEEEWLQDIEAELTDGTRIVHRTFGEGTVTKRSGDMVDILFDNGKMKRLALSIAPIKILQVHTTG